MIDEVNIIEEKINPETGDSIFTIEITQEMFDVLKEKYGKEDFEEDFSKDFNEWCRERININC